MSINSKLLAFFVGVFFLLLLATNVKSYILIFLFAFAILFFYFKYSLLLTTFILLTLSLPFENNLREWTFQVTQQLYPGVPTSGYEYFFGVNLKLIFGIFLFLLLIGKRKVIDRYSKTDLVLVGFFIIACINTLSFFSVLPTLGLIRLWLSILIYFSAEAFFRMKPKLFPIIISAMFVFSTAIGFGQLIRQKPLGKFIELSPLFSQEAGYSTTDGQSQYRVSGFISHPVYFGSFMSILLPIFIAYTLTTKVLLLLPISLLGMVVMLGTHSRSVWLTLAVILYLLFPYMKRKYKDLFSDKKGRLLISIFFTIAIAITVSRLQSISQIFTVNGNGTIRAQLIGKSFEILAKNPFGVGLNQFTTGLVDLSIPQSLRGFIVPVHNTILLITTELGILAGALFVYFIVKSIFVNKVKPAHKIVTNGAIIGAITFLISSQLHPLFNLDPTFDLFMLTLGYISSQQ